MDSLTEIVETEEIDIGDGVIALGMTILYTKLATFATFGGYELTGAITSHADAPLYTAGATALTALMLPIGYRKAKKGKNTAYQA